MDEASAQALAASALAHWGGSAAPPRLVKWRENAVFDVRLASGPRVALRLHRPGYQSRRAIAAELDWTARLAARGFPAPAPVRTRSGALTALAGDRVASAVTWMAGAPIGAAERPFEGDATAQEARMAAVGRLIADLHNTTDLLGIGPRFPRPRWDLDAFIGPDPRWGRFRENPAFTAEDRAVLDAAASLARARIPGGGAADFGLIHADCLRENILAEGERLSIIDFDDSGWGHRPYDLATALIQSLDEPNLPGMMRGLVAGYRSRRPFGAEAEALLPLFIMLRAFASAGWIMTRAASGDPRVATNARRALRMAQSCLDGTIPAGRT